MRARVISALAIPLAAVAVLAGCGSVPQNGTQTMAYVRTAYAEADGGVRVSLPVSLPSGYRLDRIWSVANVYDERGKASSIARSAEFAGPDGTVRVCTEVVEVPGDLCPQDDTAVTHDDDGLRRTVTVEPSTKKTRATAASVWGGDVTWSATPDDWTWLS
ncbi:hypothetical protein KIH74_22050 [Kineosporia sp. J2-2]|uniref:Lipoprotein n=1 Tax=Kineosporia corallincola TaxID=2835133 RepID=A0ABS5TLB4_9ACTN|nr:hypothetical protein [Kineosporia corallincola]MBT0771638.1 hypothetical protein [Kineosporia corallincola]